MTRCSYAGLGLAAVLGDGRGLLELDRRDGRGDDHARLGLDGGDRDGQVLDAVRAELGEQVLVGPEQRLAALGVDARLVVADRLGGLAALDDGQGDGADGSRPGCWWLPLLAVSLSGPLCGRVGVALGTCVRPVPAWGDRAVPFSPTHKSERRACSPSKDISRCAWVCGGLHHVDWDPQP